MQTSRLSHLIFPPTYPSSNTPAATTAPVATPQSLPIDAGSTDLAPAKTPGVIYTGSGNADSSTTTTADSGTDISKLPLENLLELGKSKGVFTKITYNSAGQLVGNGNAGTGSASTDFVSSAVSTMRDFEDGVAALKGNSATSKSGDFWTSHLKQAAAKLNVFA